MIDHCGRTIDYIRISVTDRCNLRCVYCMPPEGVPPMSRADTLSYEEILRLCRVFAGLGITKIKLTGGEPLVRKDLPDLVRRIRDVTGIRSVTLTTNGVLLPDCLDDLVSAGLDSVNISIDAVDSSHYCAVTRGCQNDLRKALLGLEAALEKPGLNVKLNCVLLDRTAFDDYIDLAALAKDRAVSVRFIEKMPIGCSTVGPVFTFGQRSADPFFTDRPSAGAAADVPSSAAPRAFITEEEARTVFERRFGAFTEDTEPHGNGPCHYFQVPGFQGRIGFISAMSHKFCADCNRVRLTSDGFLKTCLQYDTGADLRALLRSGAADAQMRARIAEAVFLKPDCHQFTDAKTVSGLEQRLMAQIGG